MGFLQELDGSAAYLKAGFLGFNGTGKTFTATEVAIGTRAFFGLTGPIAFFDTEGGSDYVRHKLLKATGRKPVGMKSRSLDDLIGVTNECVETGVSVLLVDSVTHVWRDVVNAYMIQLNASKKAYAEERGWKFRPQDRPEFQDWDKIKGVWAKWVDLYLNSPLHIIICGRAGYDYDMEENDKGKKELVRNGTKMKAEGEFGFEPSLLIEMEKEQNKDGQLIRTAFVVKDRFDVIDGKTFRTPTFKDFEPHIALLKPSDFKPIDMRVKTETGAAIDGGGDEWAREKRVREILCEEIQGMLTTRWPGQSAEEKKAKTDALETHFGTRSWTAIQGTQSGDLRSGLASLRAQIEKEQSK